ncbi:MAG TPA: DUF2059 domain-containing protein, partial [Flavobacteriaceae bacterium]|nr:DUF2059 domain-containing protein [Flavobacteriaceae bacterium]
MKKVVILIVLFVGFAGFSQNEDYKTDALKLVKMQSEGQFEVMLKPFKSMVPAENQEAFMKEVRATMPDLYKQIAEVYMEYYTHEEIKEILDFYESPIGQKVIEQTPKITEKSMTIGQTWGM